jgi:hypothetical protein
MPALAALDVACPDAEIVPTFGRLLAGRPGPVDRVVTVPRAAGVSEVDSAVDWDAFAAEVGAVDRGVQLHGGGRNSNPFLLRLAPRCEPGGPMIAVILRRGLGPAWAGTCSSRRDLQQARVRTGPRSRGSGEQTDFGGRTMPDFADDAPRSLPYPVRGQIVTYLPAEPAVIPVFSRGVATGAVLTDPDTGSRWLPVIQPDLRLDLVEFAQLVTFSPSAKPDRPSEDGGRDGR